MSPIRVAAAVPDPVDPIGVLAGKVDALTAAVTAVLPHVVTPDEDAELVTLRALRADLQAEYDAGGTITRAKVLAALTAQGATS